MKKIILLFILIIIPVNIYALSISSENYVMYNLTDDSLVMQQGADEITYVASLTKIATAITAIEKIDNLDEKITIPEEGLEGLVEANASVAGFKLGQSVTYRDLLYGLMLPSGADAAKTLAYYIAGSENEFVALMNDLVKKLNLENTNFTNNTGLHDDNHYSTVNDISKILLYALENEDFKEIFTSSKYLTSDKSITMSISYQSIIASQGLTNNYITGGKTGFTDESGYCFASTATFNDIDFLLVTAGADSSTRTPNHIIDALSIYDYVSENYKYVYIYESGDILDYIDVKLSNVHQYNITANESFQYYTLEDINTKDFTYNFTGQEYITPLTEKGKIGTVDVLYQGSVVHTFDYIYDDELSFSVPGFVTTYWEYILGGSLFLIVFIAAMNKKSRKKRR